MKNATVLAAAALAILMVACSSGQAPEPAPAPPPPEAPAPPPEPDVPHETAQATYVSNDGAKMTAVFDLTDDTVEVTLPDGRTAKLQRAISGSGARYTDGKETFWEHQGAGTFQTGEEIVFQGLAKEEEGAKEKVE